VTGVGDRELVRAGDMLGAVVTSAANEAAQALDGTFDPEAWTCVLTEVLAPRRELQPGDNVVDLGTWVLARPARPRQAPEQKDA
jgi:hypothetical protein